ncbi:hypothetical protein CDD83_10263 [Cordyceps sp. RAO-2017]|nr:hypothetical protein CDD83_10263 [Cordyceps sp. RAO-2017]
MQQPRWNRLIKPSSHRFFPFGATEWAFRIDDDIALKFAKRECDNPVCFQHENDTYDILEKHEPSIYIAQSFVRVHIANLMPLMSGGSLEQRIRGNQKLNNSGHLVEVTRKEPLHLVQRWAIELTGAVACLESLGLVQGDLRPDNLLLDGNDPLKLADFDYANSIGTRSDGNAPPWARVLGEEAGAATGSFGKNGAETEQFAIGSIIYNLTRGHRPYEGQVSGPDLVQRLLDMNFPELAGGRLDEITHRCWMGSYNTLKELAEETAGLEGAIAQPRATVLDVEYTTKMRERCRRLLEEGLLAEAERILQRTMEAKWDDERYQDAENLNGYTCGKQAIDAARSRVRNQDITSDARLSQWQ